MWVYVRVKAVGRRRDVLQPTPYSIPETVASLRELLRVVVEQEVERYNQKQAGTQLIPYLTAEEIDGQAAAGKVSFGAIFSDQRADPEKAVQNAIQCWQDGLIRVLLNETELTELDAPLSVPEDAVLTFMRLTLLAGRMW